MSKHVIDISPIVTGWAARVLPSVTGTNTNAIPCDYASEVAFNFVLVRVASTDLQFGFQFSDDNEIAGPTIWTTARSEAIMVGVGTLSPYSQLDTSAATRNLTSSIPCMGHRWVRLAGVFGTASTTDTLTISARVTMER
jgi:hypothetical protein